MWTRLYAAPGLEGLPWALQTPFPPLIWAAEHGWLDSPGPVLDVGCGVGSNAHWLARQGYRVTGIDVAPGAIRAAEGNRRTETTNPKFLVDDILASVLPGGRFRGALDVGCFQTLSRPAREIYPANLARLLSPGSPCLVFWVGREESGAWGPPHRLSVAEVVGAFEPSFLVDQVVHRPRTVRLTAQVRRSTRPLSTLAGYSARFVRRATLLPSRR